MSKLLGERKSSSGIQKRKKVGSYQFMNENRLKLKPLYLEAKEAVTETPEKIQVDQSNNSDQNNNNNREAQDNKPKTNKPQKNSTKPSDLRKSSLKNKTEDKKTNEKGKEKENQTQSSTEADTTDEDSSMKRRSASPPSLSSSFNILPPIKKEIEAADRPVEDYDFRNELDLSSFCQLRLGNISNRTLDMMLLELRKLDRDREKIIHPATIENLIHKYSVPLTPCIDALLEKFEDKTYGGLVNYEDLLHYLQEKRQAQYKVENSPLHDYFNNQPQPRNQTVTLRKGRSDPRNNSLTRIDSPKKLQRSRSWNEEKENSLMQDLRMSVGDQSIQVFT